MFDLIERAEDYPSFLPWCAASTVLERDSAIVAARINVAWHGVNFAIVTRNPKKRPEWLSVRMQQGPFRRFDGDWYLRELGAHACKIEFVLNCEFDSAVLRGVAAPVLERVSTRFVDAFVTRAEMLYGLQPTTTVAPCPSGTVEGPPH